MAWSNLNHQKTNNKCNVYNNGNPLLYSLRPAGTGRSEPKHWGERRPVDGVIRAPSLDSLRPKAWGSDHHENLDEGWAVSQTGSDGGREWRVEWIMIRWNFYYIIIIFYPSSAARRGGHVARKGLLDIKIRHDHRNEGFSSQQKESYIIM